MFSFQGASRRNQIRNFAFHASVKCLSASLFLLFHSNPLALGFEWILSLTRNSMKHLLSKLLQSISWWRLAGSNRWPPACKAGALPAELNPHLFREVVGQNGLEPSTSRLSVVCSSQLSYWPILTSLLYSGTSSMYPLNWITHRVTNTSCTDLRTLQVKTPFYLKSP